jgi:hypothetical protein
MTTYRTQLTVSESNQVLVDNLPFAPGDVVEIVIRKPRNQDLADRWRQLMKETQSLPQAQAITEEEIAAEIEAYRSGQ